VLGERLHGLTRRRAERVAGRLELTVVERAAVAQLLEQLGRDPDAGAAQRRRSDPGPPRREHRSKRLAEQRSDLRQCQHTVARSVVSAGQFVEGRVLEHAGDVVLVDELVARVEAEDRRDGRQRQQRHVARRDVRPQPVREPQHGDRDVAVALGERADGALGSTMSFSSSVRGGCGRRIASVK